MPLAQFQVLRLDNNQPASNYIYSLEQNPLLRINATSGEVFMRTDYQPVNGSVKYVLTAIPRQQASDSDEESEEEQQLLQEVAHLTLELTPQALDAYCAELEHICFWSSAHYTIAEHTKPSKASFEPVLLGSLNSRAARYLCPLKTVDYSLKAGSAFFILKQNRLFSKTPLDHDELNGLQARAGVLETTISCTVSLHGEQRQFVRSYNVTILDRNDNGPQLQERQPHFDFYLDQPYFKAQEAVGEKIIYLDKDTLAANAQLNYGILNDGLSLLQPDCHAYEADHTGRPHTIVSCQLRFSRSGMLRQTPYCVQLQARDMTIQLKHVNTTATAEVCLHVDTRRLHASDQEHPQALPLRGRQQRIFDSTGELLHGDLAGRRRIAVDYEKDVFVHRAAAAYYRVAQPDRFMDLLRLRNWRFALAEDRSGAFGLTETAGILYVRDALALEHASETVYFLNITWQDGDKHSHAFVLNVHLEEGRPANASCEVRLKSRSQTCAQVKYRQQCGKFCGLATNGGACMWRGSSTAMFSKNYGSCVPDARYCPDRVCDALEELNPLACPQDCTPASRIVGPHTSNDNKHGIQSGSGTCICEDNGR
ncbi:Ret [Drosophila busckii]|uniref:Ret n=1 Tax=Drosophila busckii TaxID=30019 RepID=A0A0M4EBT8_DROBS|nr:Ret [Drosophila busckii]